MKRLLCWLLGHQLSPIDDCKRCGKWKLEYEDLVYGGFVYRVVWWVEDRMPHRCTNCRKFRCDCGLPF